MRRISPRREIVHDRTVAKGDDSIGDLLDLIRPDVR